MKLFQYLLIIVVSSGAPALVAQDSSKPQVNKPKQEARLQKEQDAKTPRKKKAGKPKKDDRIRLIVRGDDFGFAHATNLALVEAFDDGIMTSASVMVPGPWFRESAELIRTHPEWSIGVHLTLNSEWNRLRWGPVSSTSEVPSLVARDGCFYMNHWLNDYRFLLSKVSTDLRPEYEALLTSTPPDPGEVEKELRAQIQMAKKAGIRVDYIDCHMRTACTEPLLPVAKKLAKEFCVPLAEKGLLGEKPVRISYPRGSAHPAKEGLKKMLLSLAPGLWRYVDYPARDTEELKAIDATWGRSEAGKRNATLEAWTDPEIKRIISERNIELVSIRELWDYEKCQPK